MVASQGEVHVNKGKAQQRKEKPAKTGTDTETIQARAGNNQKKKMQKKGEDVKRSSVKEHLRLLMILLLSDNGMSMAGAIWFKHET